MYFPPSKRYYYSCARIRAVFSDPNGVSAREGSGTCFLVRRDGQLFLVTNRHNVDYDYYKKTRTDYILSSIAIFGWAISENDHPHAVINRYQADIQTSEIQIITSGNDGEDLAVIGFGDSNPEVCAIPFEDLGNSLDFELSNPGEPVVMYGYSGLYNAETDAPVARSGMFASDPAHNYRGPQDISARRVAIEAFSTSGMSGSPVFALQRGGLAIPPIKIDGTRRMFLVGVNAAHYHEPDDKLGLVHSGISACIKSIAIRELIDRSASQIVQ